MKILKTLRNYLCYCGIEKDEYKLLKKDAYVANFEVWRVLHCFMAAMFAVLSVNSFIFDIAAANRTFYLIALAYSVAAALMFFFVLKKDSIIGQLFIYLSISMLLLFGALIAAKNPAVPENAFIVFLILTPLFMIDKPYFMGIVLVIAATINVFWMHAVKPFEIWKYDLANTVIFVIVGFVVHVIANSLRIKEFVLTRKIRIQKDTDDLTELKNKGAVTREINAFLADETKNKGIMLLLDIDRFKAVNDTYGHDYGDVVINRFGGVLNSVFTGGEIVGRFGGDEFIVFIKDTDAASDAEEAARRIIASAAEQIVLPGGENRLGVSAGIAIYRGVEKNYSEIFKKADTALYKTKSDRSKKFSIYEEPSAETV